MRQAEDAEVRAAGDDGADIGEDSFRLGEEPAGDPGGLPSKTHWVGCSTSKM
jgi:hypothetical protein